MGQSPVAGIGVNVACTRTTLGEQFGSIADDNLQSVDSLSQYEIKFECKPTEVPQVNVTPNFLREARFSTNGNAVDSAYELSGAADNSSQNYNLYCKPDVTPSDGHITCTVNMLGTYDAQGGYPASDVGCTSAMIANKGGTICHCPYNSASKKEECPDKAGAVGASYVAVCALPSSAGLAENNKSNW